MSPTSQTVDVCLIIPNWNGEQHLRECLDSVREQSLLPRQTILVDNGSTDNSLKLVAADYSWVTVLALSVNMGFAPAVNRGIRASSSVYVALLNNNTQLDPDWLVTLLDVLQDHPDDGRYNRREYVFGACAGAGLYRRIVFEKAGLFDEAVVAYYEDQDLAFRAQLMGFRCMYVPEALCYHKRGAIGNLLPMFPDRTQKRNLTAFYLKDSPWQVQKTRSVGLRYIL